MTAWSLRDGSRKNQVGWPSAWRLSDHHPARHSHRTTWEEAEQSLHLADGLWRNHPGAEGGHCQADSVMAGPEVLGVRRGGYGQVHPAVRCPVGLQRIRGPRTPSAMTGSEGGDTIETWRPTKTFLALTGRRQSNSGSMWEGGDGQAESTCPHYECDQPGPGAEWRHQYRTWTASCVCRSHRWPKAWVTMEAGALQTT